MCDSKKAKRPKGTSLQTLTKIPDLGVLGGKGLELLLDLVLPLLEVEASLVVVLDLLASSGLLLLGGDVNRVSTDGLVGLLVHFLNVIRLDTSSQELGELLLVLVVVFLFEVAHVISNMATIDVRAKDFGIQFLGLGIVTGETVLAVGNEDTTIGGSLHGSENTRTGGGALETSIQEALEGARGILSGLSHGDSAIWLFNTLVLVSKTELGQDATSDKETSGVGGSPVGQTTLDTVLGKFVRVSGGKNKVTLELGIDNLADNVRVGEADNKTVLGGVVLVLGLDNKTLASVVVSLALYFTLNGSTPWLITRLVPWSIGWWADMEWGQGCCCCKWIVR